MGTVVLAGATSGSTTITPTDAVTATITLPSITGTLSIDGPAFSVANGGNQSLTSNTWTKVVLNTKIFDTANAFDAVTNNRFQPTVAGYYIITGSPGNYSTSTALTAAGAAIYKNGVTIHTVYQFSGGSVTAFNVTVSAVVYLNGSTDYVELWASVTASAGAILAGSLSSTYMTGVLVRKG